MLLTGTRLARFHGNHQLPCRPRTVAAPSRDRRLRWAASGGGFARDRASTNQGPREPIMSTPGTPGTPKTPGKPGTPTPTPPKPAATPPKPTTTTPTTPQTTPQTPKAPPPKR